MINIRELSNILDIWVYSLSWEISFFDSGKAFLIRKQKKWEYIENMHQLWLNTEAVREKNYAQWFRLTYSIVDINRTVTIKFYGIPLYGEPLAEQKLVPISALYFW